MDDGHTKHDKTTLIKLLCKRTIKYAHKLLKWGKRFEGGIKKQHSALLLVTK